MNGVRNSKNKQKQQKVIRMGTEKFYFPLDDQGEKKSEFLAVRLEKQLFLDLSRKAKEEGNDLSSTIRNLCRRGLKSSGL